jgi:hypothetical protein
MQEMKPPALVRAAIASFAMAASIGSSPAFASDINIGPLCIENVDVRRDERDVTVTATAAYERATITYSEKTMPRRPAPILLVLAQPVVDDEDLPPSCSRVLSLAQAQGIGVILRGQVVDLRVKGRIGRGQANRFWIDAERGKGGFLKADIGRVTAGLRRVAGGQLNLAGGRAWIENVGDFFTTPDRLSGTFQIQSYDPTLNAARIELPGGGVATADLKLVDPDSQNLTIRVDMATGSTALWKGQLTTKQGVPLAGAAVTLPLMRLQNAALHVARITLAIQGGVISAALSKVEGKAAQASTTAQRFSVRGTAVSLAIDKLMAAATQNADRLALQPNAIEGLTGRSDAGRLLTRDVSLVEGALAVRFASVTDANVDGSLHWTAPQIHGLPLQIPQAAARQLQLMLKGPLSALSVKGGLDTTALGLAGIELQQVLAIAFSRNPAASDIAIPIAIDVPQSSGRIRFLHDGNRVALEGTLERLKLRANLTIPIADPTLARLTVPADGMALAFGASATLEPILAGAKPTFAKTGVRLGNPVPLEISRATRIGHLALESSVLIIGEPVLKIGEGAAAKRSTLKLNAEGSVLFHYPIDRQVLILARARLLAVDNSFSMEPGGSVDIGGTTITDPKISLARLFVHVDRFQPSPQNPTRIAEATALSVGGSRFERARSGPTETAWSGTPVAPFTVAKILGEPEFTETSLDIKNVSADAVRLALKDARVTVGRELALRDATVGVSIEKLRSAPEPDTEDDGTPKTNPDGTPMMVRREHLQNLTLAADGTLNESEFSPAMQLDVEPKVSGLTLTASGRSDKLSGQGSFSLGALSGTLTSPLEFDFRCRGGSKPSTNMQYRLTSGGSVTPLNIVMSNGKTALSGPLAALNAVFVSNTATDCNSDEQDYVISEERDIPVPPYPCGSFLNPRLCTTARIPRIALRYFGKFFFLALAGQITVATPVLSVRNAQTKLCYVPPALSVGPFVASMGVSPQIAFSGPVPQAAQDFVNGVIHVAAVGVETVLSTSLLNTFGNIAQSVADNPIGAGAVCLFL